MNKKIEKISDYFFKPQTALLLVGLFLISYILYNVFSGGFSKQFLKFGPTKEENGKWTTYMGLELDSWRHVVVVYFLIFIATVLQFYYSNVVDHNIDTYVFNPAVKEIPYSKFWTYFILLADPTIRTMLYVIQFFATATFQLQYILPQFLAGYLIDIPFVLKWLSKKSFI